jgi:hypothetical protein
MTTENETPACTKRAYKKRRTKSDADRAITALIVAHRFVKKDILSALRSERCAVGTNARLAYLKRLEDSEIAFAEVMTKMGVLPKNAKAESANQFVYKAVVSKGGSVQTLAVTNKQQLADLEKAEAREFNKGAADTPEDDAIREQLEAEFGSSATAKPEKKD